MNAGTRSYSIKDLENFSGIKAHTIRIWEKRYGILTPERSDSNIRSYTEEELKKLISVSILNRNGLKISRIARLSDNDLLKEVLKQGSGEEAADPTVSAGELIMPALRFNELQFRKSLLPFVESLGLEGAYVKIFYPLIQKARTLWLADCLSRPQEQFISHVIKAIILNEEAKLEIPLSHESAAVINLGDSDAESNLLFVKYLLHKKGFNPVYTESIVTDSDVRHIHSVKPFTLLAINIAPSEPDSEVKKFCHDLVRELKLRRVLVLGRYETCRPWTEGRTVAVSLPASIVSWTDKL